MPPLAANGGGQQLKEEIIRGENAADTAHINPT